VLWCLNIELLGEKPGLQVNHGTGCVEKWEGMKKKCFSKTGGKNNTFKNEKVGKHFEGCSAKGNT
jgi:hypothetical protein